jgi:hypothetical protein
MCFALIQGKVGHPPNFKAHSKFIVWIKMSWDTKANNPILKLTFGMKKIAT